MFDTLDTIVAGRRDLDAREAAWLREVAAYDRSEDWRGDGYLSCAAALRDRCRISPGTARATVELARKLEVLPALAEAFGRGDISSAHARVVPTAFTPERAGELATVERELTDAARTHTPHQLGALVRYVTDAIDADGGTASGEATHERRRLHMSRTLDGMLATDGLYDAEAAEIHQAAINAEMERDRRENDPRSPAQRRADALTSLLRQSLERAEVGSTRNARPHITVVLDVRELTGAHRLVRALEGARRARPSLPGARLPPASRTLRGSPRRPVEPRRSDGPRESRARLLVPPPTPTYRRRDGKCPRGVMSAIGSRDITFTTA